MTSSSLRRRGSGSRGDVVEGSFFRLVFPDAGVDLIDADLGDRRVLGLSGFIFLRVRHFRFPFLLGRLQCQPVISVSPAKPDRTQE